MSRFWFAIKIVLVHTYVEHGFGKFQKIHQRFARFKTGSVAIENRVSMDTLHISKNIDIKYQCLCIQCLI